MVFLKKKVNGDLNSVDTSVSWRLKDNVLHADETANVQKTLPDKTFGFKSVKCHGGKENKERLTVLISANTSGTEKLFLRMNKKSKRLGAQVNKQTVTDGHRR